MRRILIFIGLKLMELSLLAIGCTAAWFIGHLIYPFIPDCDVRSVHPVVMEFLIGIVVALMSFVVFCVSCLIIGSNWKKAGEIEKKWGKK